MSDYLEENPHMIKNAAYYRRQLKELQQQLEAAELDNKKLSYDLEQTRDCLLYERNRLQLASDLHEAAERKLAKQQAMFERYGGTAAVNLAKQAGRAELEKELMEQEPDYFLLTVDNTWMSVTKEQYDSIQDEHLKMRCYTKPFPQQKPPTE